jgi:4,5-DOPA dioxygenase extradiol
LYDWNVNLAEAMNMPFMPNPAIPAGAYTEFKATAGPVSASQRAWTPDDGTLPALFISHGAPMLLDDPEWMRQLGDLALTLPKPRGVLIVSAHWEEAPLMLSATAANTPLIYDFNFEIAPEYGKLTYFMPDASALAREVASLMPDTAPIHQHSSRGLDNGAWVPLMVMYPLGDVPVLQMSIPSKNPAKLLEIGARLKPLRESGVLVIGSGFTTHGLPDQEVAFSGGVPGWSSDFDLWAADALARKDIDELTKYTEAPGMPFAHPKEAGPDHFLPLFVTLGAASDLSVPAKTVIDGYWLGLAKRSVQVN